MAANPSVLMLTLNVFSATGGIEKVCRVAGKSLYDLKVNADIKEVQIYSMYDRDTDIQEKYFPAAVFRGFCGSRLQYIYQAVLQGRKSNIVILSHINLILVGFLVKLFSPGTKLVLFAHGIEVWGPLSLVRKYMLRKCNLILAVSRYTRDTMHAQYHIPLQHFFVLNNCLDPFLPEPVIEKPAHLGHQYGIEQQDTVLLTLTRLAYKERYKGYDHVLYSVQQLKADYPGIKYLLVGKYDDAEKKRLDKIIHQLGIQAHVIFTGFVEDAALAAHFALADLYVMPSKKEGFGIVFIEALYYGLPVIAGNADGSVDALDDGRFGLLVNPEDAPGIQNAIQHFLENRKAYIPAREAVEDKFGFSRYRQNLLYALTGKNISA
ncbi:MAG TPA: glycosyltransferase family 4 protein [Ferruginibacter sp.]|nr:glycosyltransferase family 4 protein [Ferruginibacter sp.]HMP21268.1 glycosyltransferase family 4 protein [Ferruginibacter sp.]